ncbi:uncharacterized protein C20orf173 homolog isoform X2 [Suricata suricatta]|uniref:uncharacterized protein C20orf173 homolog isoform X2 n=1 Tax=Suricata suricatta TaxID=37032 RepID=UPI0011558AEA|nr:uncharacterized protein C20orf173 homolog isoform X2 [Suricata suricatta]
MCYLSVLESGIPGTARVLFEGEQMDMEAGDDRLRGGVAWTVGEPWRPMGQRDAGASAPPSSQSQVEKSVCCLPGDLSSGLNMKRLWQISVLWGFWVLISWLITPCLDPNPESAPQGKLMVLVPGYCNCPWFQFRKSGCPSETLNSSLCYQRVGEWGWFAECFQKTVEYLTMGATESMTPDAVLWWLGINSVSGLGKMWEKVFKVIHRPSVSHFHLYCGTCTLLGNSKILQGSGLRNNVNQWTAAFRMNPDPVQSTEIMGNQTTGRFISPGKASSQGSWRQPVLPLKLSGLAWTSDAPSITRTAGWMTRVSMHPSGSWLCSVPCTSVTRVTR